MSQESNPVMDRDISRRAFFGAVAVTVGAGAVMAPALVAQESGASGEAMGSAGQGRGTAPAGRTDPKQTDIRHLISLKGKQPRLTNDAGSLMSIDKSDLNVMSGLSIRRLTLAPRGVREPHWHANAGELAYCLRGEHLVTIFGNENQRNSFTISPGQMFFVPLGALHHVENIGDEQGEMILGFSHEYPEDFGLSGTFGSFTDAVLGNTTGLPASSFHRLKRTPQDTLLGKLASDAVVELQEREENAYKYDLEGALPQINSTAGSAHTAKASVWPILSNIAMFSVHISTQGMREVHWHPDTAEMGYVTEGRGRMTIVSPGGSLDTYEMSAGDTYFIPRSYPHHIEDIGDGELKLLVFFNQRTPGDIGMSTAIGAYSRGVIAAAFGLDMGAVPDFSLRASDGLIVPRVNPLDPSKSA